MDEVSLTRSASGPAASPGDSPVDHPPELRVCGDAAEALESLIAGSHLCDQVASLLGVEERVARWVFLGEPVTAVLGVVGWVLSREEREALCLSRVLPALARKRKRGVWREEEDLRVERCARCSDGGYGGHGASSTKPGGTPALCPCCRDSRVQLKPLSLLPAGGRR